MHKLTAVILLISFLGQNFRQEIYYFDYLVDTAAYEKNCVNKARPQLRCKGKCQLMKKLEEQEKKQAPEMKLASKTEVISSKSFFVSHISIIRPESKSRYSDNMECTPVDQPSYFFHPPNS